MSSASDQQTVNGLIAGIVVASVLFLLLLIFVILFLTNALPRKLQQRLRKVVKRARGSRKKKKKKKQQHAVALHTHRSLIAAYDATASRNFECKPAGPSSTVPSLTVHQNQDAADWTLAVCNTIRYNVALLSHDNALLDTLDTESRKCSLKSEALTELEKLCPTSETASVKSGKNDEDWNQIHLGGQFLNKATLVYPFSSFCDADFVYRDADVLKKVAGNCDYSYIVSACPQASSDLAHFWMTILERRVQYVVLLDSLPAAQQYWPAVGGKLSLLKMEQKEPLEMVEIEVELLQESQFANFFVRKLQISTKQEKRTVTQFNFINWLSRRPTMGPKATEDSMMEELHYLLDREEFLRDFIEFSIKFATERLVDAAKGLANGVTLVHEIGAPQRCGVFLFLCELRSLVTVNEWTGECCIQLPQFVRYLNLHSDTLVTQSSCTLMMHLLFQTCYTGYKTVAFPGYIAATFEELSKPRLMQANVLQSQHLQIERYTLSWLCHGELRRILCKSAIIRLGQIRNKEALAADHYRASMRTDEFFNALGLPNARAHDAYFVAETPNKTTSDAFWSMVMQHQLDIIVDLDTRSSSQSQADLLYYPTNIDTSAQLETDEYHLTCLHHEKTKNGAISVRLIRIEQQTQTSENANHTIFHVHLHGELDHGMVFTLYGLVRELTSLLYKPNSGTSIDGDLANAVNSGLTELVINISQSLRNNSNEPPRDLPISSKVLMHDADEMLRSGLLVTCFQLFDAADTSEFCYAPVLTTIQRNRQRLPHILRRTEEYEFVWKSMQLLETRQQYRHVYKRIDHLHLPSSLLDRQSTEQIIPSLACLNLPPELFFTS